MGLNWKRGSAAINILSVRNSSAFCVDPCRVEPSVISLYETINRLVRFKISSDRDMIYVLSLPAALQ